MKKILKIIAIIGCIFLVIFLLLPFLETSSSSEALTEKAEPQIFTSNPLTALLNKLAPFFRRGEKQEQPLVRLSAKEIDETFGTPQSIEANASVTKNSTPNNLIASAKIPTEQQEFPKESSSDTEKKYTEDWVLVRQTNPETSTQGMHEINIRENPYDAYVRQQKNAMHTPTVVQQTYQTAPKKPSLWQKAVSPVKRFFGFSDPQEVSPSSLEQQSSEEAFQLASSRGLNNASVKSSSANYQQPFAVNDPGISLPSSLGIATQREKMQLGMKELYHMLEPKSLINDAVNALANAKYPEPLSEEKRQEKQQFIRENSEKLWQDLQNYQRQRMEQLYTNQSLQGQFKDACKNEALPIATACEMFSEEGQSSYTPSSLSDAELRAIQNENQQIWQNITRMPLPEVPVTPVLGVANSPIQLSQTDEQGHLLVPPGREKEIQIVNDIYQWQFEQHRCAQNKNSCFYVANSLQNDPPLKDVVDMMSASFVGDPNNKYQRDAQPYVNYRLSQLGENISDEERQTAAQQAREDYQKYPPHYLIYTKDEMRQHQQELGNAVSQDSNTENASFFLMMNGTQAVTLADAIGSTGFLYDSQKILFDDKADSAKISHSFVESSAQLARDSYERAAEQATELSEDALKEKMGQSINEYNRILKENGGDAFDAFHQILQQGK